MATSTAPAKTTAEISSLVEETRSPQFRATYLPVLRSAVSQKLLAVCIGLDFVVIFLVGVITALTVTHLGNSLSRYSGTIWQDYVPALLIEAVFCILFSALRREYERWPRPGFLNRFKFAALPCALSVLPLIPLLIEHFTAEARLVIVLSACLDVPALMIMRFALAHLVHTGLKQVDGFRNVLIVGTGRIAHKLAEHFEQNPHLGYVLAGFLSERSEPTATSSVLGYVDQLPDVARQYFVDEVFITVPTDQQKVARLALQARRQRLNLHVVPETYDDLAWRAPVSHAIGYPILQLHREPISVSGLFAKRLVDVLGSSFLLVFSAPVALVIAGLIKFGSSGPVLYISPRVGKKGRIFEFYKFRTMVQDAEQRKNDLLHLNERDGLLFKMRDDPRITRIGRLLRKFSLDELPQLWNVLRGDMSLVGPRPPVPEEYDQYSLECLKRMDIKPGVTGLWQISARTDPSFEKYMQLDLAYIENWNFRLDWKILLKTLPTVLRGTGQ